MIGKTGIYYGLYGFRLEIRVEIYIVDCNTSRYFCLFPSTLPAAVVVWSSEFYLEAPTLAPTLLSRARFLEPTWLPFDYAGTHNLQG